MHGVQGFNNLAALTNLLELLLGFRIGLVVLIIGVLFGDVKRCVDIEE